MKSLKQIANITSLLGILSFSIGIFFVFGKIYSLQRSREVTNKWSDQVYSETYQSGYEHGSLEPDEKIHISLEVEPRDIRYDMNVVKDAERDYIPIRYLSLMVIGGFITTVIGCYLSGKVVGKRS